MGIRTINGALAAACLALVACDVATPVDPVPRPAVRPDRPMARPERPPVRITERSEESRELEGYYRRVQDSLVAQGLLRSDGGGPDTPFGVRQLVENFVQIALRDEYSEVGGTLVARGRMSELKRWEQPITLQLEFGATVDPAIQARDRNSVIAYAGRLSRVTGHPIRQVGRGGNFTVFIVNANERRDLGPRLRAISPSFSESVIRQVTHLPRDSYCLAFAIEGGRGGAYSQAVVVIPAEHPDLMRLSCIHEEIAQGLGLANDSPAARPSIFNDDEEFGLLTTHDEMLLRMLYDRRLRIGMEVEEARPIAQAIAVDLLGGES